MYTPRPLDAARAPSFFSFFDYSSLTFDENERQKNRPTEVGELGVSLGIPESILELQIRLI